MFLPVAAAVGIGVALSLLLQLNQGAMDLAVVELVPRDDGRFEEHPPPATLTSQHVTILDVYGSLMYAGARTLQAHLPDPGEARSPVVVLRLRRRTSLGATFVKVVADYADRLAEADGRLYLSGLDPALTERLRRTGHIDGRCARSRPARLSVSQPGPPIVMPRPGSSRGKANEPALWRLSRPDRDIPRPSRPGEPHPPSRCTAQPGHDDGVSQSRGEPAGPVRVEGGRQA